MPHDLFDDVVARPQAVRSRRSPLVIASLAIHGALVTGFVVASVVTPAALPFPETPLCLCTDIRLVSLPKLPPTTEHKTTTPGGSPLADAVLVPVVAPPNVGDEKAGGNLPEDDGEPGRGIGEDPITERLFDGPGLPQTIEPPPPVAQAPIRLHSGIRAPRKVSDAAPVYPALAREAHVQGVVIIEATIDATGVVQEARVLRSIPLLDDAAVSAVRQWRFEPARLNDQPVAVVMTVTVNFTLSR